MTRINTNVSSLVAQNTLGRSNASLNQALTRLSTGLRINTGKDDPAGLIASENLRSDITSIRRAISNTDRANQVIATADSALGQVSSLLNDIRGLVTESANAGALSDEQLNANQLQVDSSLEALNRIAQTTTFQGRRLLDGSLDFIVSAGTGYSTVSDLKIDQANLGATGQVAVSVNISSAASQARITNNAVAAAVDGVAASSTLTFTDAATAATGSVDFVLSDQQATGTITLDTASSATFVLTAVDGGPADGAEGNGVKNIVIVDNAAEGTSYSAVTNTLTVTVDITGGNNTVDDLVTVINADTDFVASGTTNGADAILATNTGTGTLAGGQDAETANIAITATAGSAGNISISFAEVNGIGATPTVTNNGGGSYTINIDDTVETTIADIATAIDSIAVVASATTASTASYDPGDDSTPATENLIGGNDAGNDVITVSADQDGTTANGITVTVSEAAGVGATPTAAFLGNNIVVTVDDTVSTSIADIATAINNLDGYAATVTGTAGDGNYVGATDTAPGVATLAGGTAASGGLDDDIVLEISGALGAEVLSFGQNTSITLIINAVNAVSDATGVSAANDSGDLVLTSDAYGSNAFVSVKVLSGDINSTFVDGLSDDRDEGTDIVASVNGIAASGDGNTLSVNTATLDLSLTVNAGSSSDVNFTITGGGALFQLGPDVVSNQQARLGITSVNTARLGGVSGKLFQLGTGGTASLTNDPTTAALIVEEAIDQITSLRGRLGAFQRTTLETNKQALNDTLVNLTDAESTIRDADFASETAALTRAQILVQSGTTVLQIANANPQNVLALLRG